MSGVGVGAVLPPGTRVGSVLGVTGTGGAHRQSGSLGCSAVELFPLLIVNLNGIFFSWFFSLAAWQRVGSIWSCWDWAAALCLS